MVIYQGPGNNGKAYLIQYVEKDNTEENYPPYTLALTRNSVSEEILSQLEKTTIDSPLTDFELEFVFGKIKFERIERIEFIE